MKNLRIGLHISQILKKWKDVHRNYVQIGCDTFPNGLVWFHFEAKPIWVKFPKHRKNSVICYIWLWLAMPEIIKTRYFLKMDPPMLIDDDWWGFMHKKSLVYTQKNLLLSMHKRSLVHAQHSCACSGPGTPGARDPKRQLGRSQAPLVYTQEILLCIHNKCIKVTSVAMLRS